MIRKSSFWLAALLCASLLSACTEKQPLLQRDPVVTVVATKPPHPQDAQTAIKDVANMQDRLARVAAPLLLKNHTSCKKFARPLMGFTARNQFSYSSELAKETQLALGLGDALEVAVIFPNSGAARSGLRRGDRLSEAGQQAMPQGATAEEAAPRILVPLLEAQKQIDLTVIRNEKSLHVSITPSLACAFRMELGNADNVNSYTDGSRVMVTRGMMRFVQSDTELAYVIAREVAHAALRHPYRLKSAPRMAKIIDTLRPVFPKSDDLDILTELSPYPRETDAIADRLAVRMLKRAGISTAGVIPFWQRLAQQYPKTDSSGHTAIHPDTAYRIAAIKRTLAAIQASDKIHVYVPKKSGKPIKKRRR